MNLKDTLKQLRKKKGWTQQDLSDHSILPNGEKVKREVIAKAESGKNGFSPENQKAVADALGVEPEELSFVKKSEIVRRPGHLSPKAEKTLLFLSEIPEENAEDYIPYYDIEVTAGRIEVYFDDDVDETPAGYLYAPQYRGCAMFHLKGDSMYDRIFPGSRMFVWYMKDKKYIEFGQIFLVVLPGERLLKYIFPHPTDPTYVLLRSHNSTKYPDIPVEKADIIHLFKVKGYENQNAL